MLTDEEWMPVLGRHPGLEFVGMDLTRLLLSSCSVLVQTTRHLQKVSLPCRLNNARDAMRQWATDPREGTGYGFLGTKGKGRAAVESVGNFWGIWGSSPVRAPG